MVYFTLLVAVCTITTIQSQSHSDPSAVISDLGGKKTFTEPETLQAAVVQNSWSLTLNAAVSDVSFGWLNLKRRLYNGRICGPTWIVKRGETLTVTLNNNLDNSNINAMLNRSDPWPYYRDKTNLHTHGLYISGEVPHDDVTININPDENFQYIYEIDSEQPPGTYWYHPHRHGSTAFQVHSGMSGMLIVEDSIEELKKIPELRAVSCPENCIHDVQLVLQPVLQYSSRGETIQRHFTLLQDIWKDNAEHRLKIPLNPPHVNMTLEDWLEINIDHYTVNGQLVPVLTMKPGQMKRFRMVNAGGADLLELYIVKSDGRVASESECSIREIALDGVYLDAPRRLRLGQTVIWPAGRIDWMVKCDVVGSYVLRSEPLPENKQNFGEFDHFKGDIMSIEVTGNAVNGMDFPTILTTKPHFLTDLQNEKDIPLTQRFVIEMNFLFYINRERYSGPSNFRYKMEVDTLQEWTVVNAHSTHGHVLHTHINHFQVIRFNEYVGPYETVTVNLTIESYKKGTLMRCSYTDDRLLADTDEGYDTEGIVPREPVIYRPHHTNWEKGGVGTLAYSQAGDWRDTMVVPPLSNITIRFRAHKYLGKMIVHCHILPHEDLGMMMVTAVVPKGASLDANILSKSDYPFYQGTCTACDHYPPGNASTVGRCSAFAASGNSWMFMIVFMLQSNYFVK